MFLQIKAPFRGLFKLIEVVMVLTTLFCFHYASNIDQMDSQNLIHGTLVGYTILLIVFILAEILNTKVDYTLTILLTFMGFAFLIATGIILIDKGVKDVNSTEDYMITAAGSLGIVNGILFLLDSIFISNRQEPPPGAGVAEEEKQSKS